VLSSEISAAVLNIFILAVFVHVDTRHISTVGARLDLLFAPSSCSYHLLASHLYRFLIPVAANFFKYLLTKWRKAISQLFEHGSITFLRRSLPYILSERPIYIDFRSEQQQIFSVIYCKRGEKLYLNYLIRHRGDFGADRIRRA